MLDICDKCLCKASKNNPCTAKPRCEKCGENTHRETDCTKLEYCNVYGHIHTFMVIYTLIDGDCIFYAEKLIR